MKKTVLISQSLIKDMANYRENNYCGVLMEYKYIDGGNLPSTNAQKLGHYFEYIATGQLPRDGKKPEPELLKTQKRLWTEEEVKNWLLTWKMPGTLKTPPLGIAPGDLNDIPPAMKNHKEQVHIHSLTAEYKRAHLQALNFKQLCKEMGITILETGEYGTRNGLDGTRDIKAKYGRKIITIDLKYSGLMNDEWNPLGWKDLVNGNKRERQLDNHIIQATQYKYIFGNPFYYWVFSSSTGAEETGENLFIHMDIQDKRRVDYHLKRAKNEAKEFNRQRVAGFEPRPHYNVCSQCELFSTCEHASRIQEPIVVKI